MRRVLATSAVLMALAAVPAAIVPSSGAAQAGSAVRPSSSAGVVNINTATADELKRLPGVGDTRAQAIIAARQRQPFRRAQDIMRVRGIGRATYRRIEPMLAVDGPTTLLARAQ